MQLHAAQQSASRYPHYSVKRTTFPFPLNHSTSSRLLAQDTSRGPTPIEKRLAWLLVILAKCGKEGKPKTADLPVIRTHLSRGPYSLHGKIITNEHPCNEAPTGRLLLRR